MTIPHMNAPTRSAAFQANQHNQALAGPSSKELPFLKMFEAVQLYCDTHAKRYGAPVGHDGYTGPVVATICNALIDLLNTEHGRLDAATVETAVRTLAKSHALELEA